MALWLGKDQHDIARHVEIQAIAAVDDNMAVIDRWPRPGHPGQRSISPPPTQKDLAARIGTRREVVSREVAHLKRHNIVDKTTGALILCDLPKLNAMITAGWEEAD